MSEKYAHLKGKFIKFTGPYGHVYKDCFVAAVDEDKGLTIMGTFIRWADDPVDVNYNTIEKIYCLNFDMANHRKMFPCAIEAIEAGEISSNEVYAEAGVSPITTFNGGDPMCAFE